ncbi:hypothetical protein B0T17DRAFT_546318 [Bombardia bombarda]|uniref:DUF8021 domain-containing protein n=1 Tax=Bombardia bombarda TaxID=252184 RepID=A0AA39TJQ6_9PEZI|nr:hypothetical protein B0T17DRAFT_546318 [Bombardia bombarda]
MVRQVFLPATTLVALLLPTALGSCQWSVLRMNSDSYIESQASGELDPSFLPSSIKYTENDRSLPIKSGLISRPLKLDHTHVIIDQTGCAIHANLIVTSPSNPYVVATHIYYTPRGSTGSALDVSLVDTIVTTTGDYNFNASATLAHFSSEDWSSLSRTKQDTRETLQAAADAYLDLWSNSSAIVPWGAPCARLEGGEYVTGTAGEECAKGLPNGTQPANTNRRYVIDETVGAVSVFSSFGSAGGAPDSHEFRVLDGKVKYVHRITASGSVDV